MGKPKERLIMIFKTMLILMPLFLMISCKLCENRADYFDQSYPGSIPIVFAPDIISLENRLEHGISFSPDLKELAFGILDKNNLKGEIFYSKKINGRWTVPVIFAPLKDECVFLPYFSPNGKQLLYAQSKNQTENFNTDIWMIEKINNEWLSPKEIHSPINSLSREANACMTLDGTIYFSSNRMNGDEQNYQTADLFYSKLVDNKYESVDAIQEFVSLNDEESVFVSPKEDYIIFCRYTDDETGADLYISYRDKNNSWIEPQMIDSTINSKAWDRRPFVSMDNKFLFFTRLQIGTEGLTASDVYWVNTSKLFKPFVYNPMSDLTVNVGQNFEISVPKDYFKDVDDSQLDYSIHQNQFNWINFDGKSMKLSGLPLVEGNFELIFTVTDGSANLTSHKIKITVIKS